MSRVGWRRRRVGGRKKRVGVRWRGEERGWGAGTAEAPAHMRNEAAPRPGSPPPAPGWFGLVSPELH